jgi:tRNA(fMet)-specific endonuclease VapC
MKRYIIDTSILLHYIRQSGLALKIESEHQLMSQDVVPMVAAVSIGEIEGFVQRRNWGEKKMNVLKKLLSRILVVDIAGQDENLMKAFATLNNYSRNCLPEKPLGRSVSIGQNDLWIAAVAKVAKAELITADGDFDHLDGVWLAVHKYDQRSNKE